MSRSFKSNGKHLTEGAAEVLQIRGKGKGSMKLAQQKLRDEKHNPMSDDGMLPQKYSAANYVDDAMDFAQGW